MALKHLLNDDNLDNDFHRYTYEKDFDFSEEALPHLQQQSWGEYTGEVFGTQSIPGDLVHPFDMYESLQPTQSHIEQWITDPTIIPQSIGSEGLHEELHEESDICYGTLKGIRVQLCGDMTELLQRLIMSNKSPITGHVQVEMAKLETGFSIIFADRTVIGTVNSQLEKALKKIEEQQYSLKFDVFAPLDLLKDKIGRASKEKEAVVRVQITVYGPPSAAQGVGRELSSHKLYLQQTEYVREGTSYDNPHVLVLPTFQHSTTEVPLVTKEAQAEKATTEVLKNTITDVFSSLTRSNDLRGVEADGRLITPLLLHQKKALDFMMQRESGPIPEKYTLWKATDVDGVPGHRHSVTQGIIHREPIETGGGILADEMGMGKSLSVLALVLRTLDAAHQWAIEQKNTTDEESRGWRIKERSRATLIIASSDLMINQWFEELDLHFDDHTRKSLTKIKYHGQKGKALPNKLCDADIVITTYHTLASDISHLKDVEWYRIVLDEAHIIRRQATKFYRSCSDIEARSRWCLTGTPIQNRLDDIGSLFAFLKIAPFHNLANFRKFISIPFDEGLTRRKLAIQRFMTLFDSLCLRSKTEELEEHLPGQESRVRSIELSEEERKQYDHTHEIMFRAIRNQHGDIDKKSTLGMFQVQLQLRIICNHGTWQQPFSWTRRKLYLQDEREAIEASLEKDDEKICFICKQSMPIYNTGSTFRHFEGNCHVICSQCLEQSLPSTQESLPTKCPVCHPLWKQFEGTPQTELPSFEDTYFRAEGQSSKMELLMMDVLTDLATTKSIIFTCWTRTLDLLEIYLQKASLIARNYQRIDGESTTSKREKIIHGFANSPDLRILIMTTGTGAVGLNLAMANRVFIVEPQWNPSVENQAIARASRLGQKQPVLVTRYVVNQTVETSMQSLQGKKREAANIVETQDQKQ